MKIVGIDPGLTGAIAHMQVDRTSDGRTQLTLIKVHDMPVFEIKSGSTKKKHLNLRELPNLITQAGLFPPDMVYIEEVSAAPGQGVASMFRFGYVAGALAGVCAGLGLKTTMIRPQVWQSNVKVNKGPDEARRRATELFPQHSQLFSRSKDHNRADATLIAVAGSMTIFLKS